MLLSFPDLVFPNIRHLRVFREVALCHSITEAARRVHLSQPAVTQAISKLEQEFGLPLFTRQRDGLFPTAIGERFCKRTESALNHLQAGARQAQRLGNKAKGRGFSNFDEMMTAAQLRASANAIKARNCAAVIISSKFEKPRVSWD